MILLKALRLPFVMVSGLNFSVIWLYAAYTLNSDFYLGLTGIVFIHLAANMWNDYYDYEADLKNKDFTPFAGGSRVLQNGLMSRKKHFVYCVLLTLAAFSIGIIVFYRTEHKIALLLIMLTGGLLSFFYTASPIRLVYRSMGELTVFITFGPLLYAGISAMNGLDFSLMPFLVSVISGMATARILYLNELSDHDADLTAGKRTLPVLLTLQVARRAAPVFSVCISLCLILTVSSIHMLIISALLVITAEIFVQTGRNRTLCSLSGLIFHNALIVLLLINLNSKGYL